MVKEDDFDRPQIFYSIANRDKESFDKELAQLDNIDITDSNGMNLLFFACIHNDIHTATKLIEKGIKIDTRDKFGNTPLWRATFECKGKYYDIVELLVNNGADVYSLNYAQKSPIMFAQTIGNQKLVSILKQEATNN